MSVHILQIKKIIIEKLILSAHDCSDGGLFITLAESAMKGDLGFEITTDKNFRKDAFLFGEAQSRVVVSVSPAKQKDFELKLKELGTDGHLIGKVTANDFIIDNQILLSVTEAKDLYDNALGKLIEG